MRRFVRQARNASVVAAAACLAATVPATVVQATPFAAPPRAGSGITWGGYVAQGAGFRSISASWVQPSVRCTATSDKYAPWIGIDGYGSAPVEQVGVETNCESGAPQHRPWFEMYPAHAQYWPDDVAAGDRMTAMVADRGGGHYVITLTDTTRGWTERSSQHRQSPDASAEAVIESPTGRYPDFGAVTFDAVRVNGEPFGAAHPRPDFSDGYGPGPLRGGSFTVSR